MTAKISSTAGLSTEAADPISSAEVWMSLSPVRPTPT